LPLHRPAVALTPVHASILSTLARGWV